MYQGSLKLETQSDLNNFNYTEGRGFLSLNSENIVDDAIRDLSPLSSLTRLGGGLTILDIDAPNLDAIRRSLFIINSSKLKNIDGLSNVETIIGIDS